MDFSPYQIITAVIAIIFLVLFVRNIMVYLLAMENYKIHKKRLQQLKKQKSGGDDLNVTELVDTLTKPIITNVLSEFRFKNRDELAMMIKMAQWNKVFTPASFRALNLLLKVGGVVMAAALWNLNKPVAVVWGGIMFFALGFFLKNTYNNRKEELIRDFPDFIRVTEGYLSANMPFAQAITESIKYVGDEWKPILQKLAVDIEVKGINKALDNLKSEVDIFDVREFVALVRLTLDQGGDAKKSFQAQADRIRSLQKDLMAIKIGQRQTMSIMLQAPLLLSAMVMFALPTVGAMMEFGAM